MDNDTNYYDEYRCTNCNKKYDFLFVQNNCKNWRCSECNHLLSIKIEFEGDFYDCNKILPKELKIHMLIIFKRSISAEVLDVKKEGPNYRVALKKYTVVTVKENSFLLVINGGWYE